MQSARRPTPCAPQPPMPRAGSVNFRVAAVQLPRGWLLLAQSARYRFIEMDDHELRRKELTIQLKRYRQLEPFVMDRQILYHIRELEAEIVGQLRKLDAG